MTTAIIIILVILIGVLLFGINNLIKKEEVYEDITNNQLKYIKTIDSFIKESQKHLNSLDERGVFKADDEVGYFFEQMLNIQRELDRFQLPENYGKKEEQ